MAKEFFLKVKNDDFGNGWWSGVEPHPTKKLGVFVYADRVVVREPVSFVINDHGFSSRPAAQTWTVQVDDPEFASSDLCGFAIIVQYRDDWQATTFTSTDGREHEEDALREDYMWEGDPEYRPCRVPRRWTRLPIEPGEYSDEWLAERKYLREVFGITEENFPKGDEPDRVVAFPWLNHFDRRSCRGTIMWSYPVLHLCQNRSFWLDCAEDAVSRMRQFLKDHGIRLNRGKAIYAKLDRSRY